MTIEELIEKIRGKDDGARGMPGRRRAAGRSAVKPLADVAAEGAMEASRAAKRALWKIVRHADGRVPMGAPGVTGRLLALLGGDRRWRCAAKSCGCFREPCAACPSTPSRSSCGIPTCARMPAWPSNASRGGIPQALKEGLDSAPPISSRTWPFPSRPRGGGPGGAGPEAGPGEADEGQAGRK